MLALIVPTAAASSDTVPAGAFAGVVVAFFVVLAAWLWAMLGWRRCLNNWQKSNERRAELGAQLERSHARELALLEMLEKKTWTDLHH
jgi:hypothetical protein